MVAISDAVASSGNPLGKLATLRHREATETPVNCRETLAETDCTSCAAFILIAILKSCLRARVFLDTIQRSKSKFKCGLFL
jgi:hypothetical protein